MLSLLPSLLLMLAVMQPLAGTAFALDGILIGAGDMRFLAKSMLGAAALFLVAVALAWTFAKGLVSIWAAIAFFMAVRSVLLGIRIRGSAWTMNSVSLP